MQIVHSAYIIQPKKKDVVKLLLKLLAPSKYSSSSLKVNEALIVHRRGFWLGLTSNAELISCAESPSERRPWALQPHRPQPANGPAGRLPHLLPPELGVLYQGSLLFDGRWSKCPITDNRNVEVRVRVGDQSDMWLCDMLPACAPRCLTEHLPKPVLSKVETRCAPTKPFSVLICSSFIFKNAVKFW